MKPYIERLKILLQKMELQGADIDLGVYDNIKLDCRIKDLENGVDEVLGEKEIDI